jgi:signal transduction histidine kinase
MEMKPKTAARVAWSVGASSIALMVGTLVLMFLNRRAVHLPQTTNGSSETWTFSNVLSNVVNISVPTMGILLASRRPANRIGWLFLIAGATLGLGAFGTAYALRALVVARGSLPAGHLAAWFSNSVGLIPLGALAFLFLLFPTGQLPSPRWRLTAWILGVLVGLETLLSVIGATTSWNDPFSQQSGFNWFGVVVFLLPVVFIFVTALTAVIVRFRRSRGDERQQLKWFVTAAAFVVVTLFATIPSTSPVLSVVQSLGFILLWISIGVAVLKYRLYEIDVVINKAVVYGALAVFITLVYVGLVVGVGALVGNQRSPLLSAVAAAVIAVAFQPVRQRAGRLANRLVYGTRATPYEVLADFADRVAGSYTIEDVLPRTAQMLAEGTGAQRADVWLRVGRELRAEGSWPSESEAEHASIEGDAPVVPGATAVVPVSHQGELLGALSVHKAASDPLTPTDEKLLVDVASQAGLVLRNVRLIEDLRASRLRLVTAQDEARRRLERNIHDGAQQQLVALAMKLNLAQSAATKAPEKLPPMLEQLKGDAQDALDNLRDLARGIYPPLLADQGLVAALTSQARKSAVPVTLDAEGLGRFSRDAETAVYFCALEALQNIAKYANATGAIVRLATDDGRVTFAVEDDGVGFDPDASGHGTGLQGMADRIAAIGGALQVRSAPGRGTVISGWVPVDSPV